MDRNADVGAESEDPGDDLGAETHAHTDVDLAAAHERFLRAVPAVAAHERGPPAGQADLDDVHGVLFVHEDAEAVGEHALRIVAILVRVLERPAHRLGGVDPREPVGVRLAAARAADDVKLVIVDRERERLDAQRLPPAIERPVPDLQAMAPLQRIDDLLEQLLLFRQGFLAAADEEHELPSVVLEPLRVDRLAAHGWPRHERGSGDLGR